MDHGENLDVFPMLAMHATEIVIRLNPVKIDDYGSYDFPDPVECQDVVPFGQGRMSMGSTGNNRPVISKHVGF